MEKGTKLKREDRRAQILKIASDIFYRDGYEMGSLNAIARRAGITKAAIYHHFQNKEQVLYNIIQDSIDQLILDLKEISRREEDPIKELKEMIEVQVSYTSQKRNTKIVFEEGHFLGKKYEGIIRNRQREIVEIYKSKLNEIASAGKLKDISPTTARFSILGIIIWLYQWYNPNGKLSIEKIKDDIIKIVFSGLIKEDEKKQVEKEK